jgi:Flp pilus assembly protein TadG
VHIEGHVLNVAKRNQLMTRAGTEIEGLRPPRTRLWAEERAAEVVEMAFVLPLLLTLMIGIFWAARAYNIYETITRAAREGARVAVAPTCFGCGSNGAFLTASSGCSATDAIDLAVINSMAASGMPCKTGVTVSVSQHQALGDDTAGSSTQWTVVTVKYPFQFVLPFTSVSMTTLNISTTAQMVEEP